MGSKSFYQKLAASVQREKSYLKRKEIKQVFRDESVLAISTTFNSLKSFPVRKQPFSSEIKYKYLDIFRNILKTIRSLNLLQKNKFSQRIRRYLQRVFDFLRKNSFEFDKRIHDLIIVKVYLKSKMPEKALNYLKSHDNISTNDNMYIYLLNDILVLYFCSNQHHKALELYNECISISRNNSYFSKNHTRELLFCYYKQQYKRCLDIIQQSRTYRDKRSFRIIRKFFCCIQNMLKYSIERTEKRNIIIHLKMYIRLLRNCEIADAVIRTELYLMLGKFYSQQENFQLALKFYKKSLKTTKTRYFVQTHLIYTSIGCLLFKQKMPEKALHYFRTSLRYIFQHCPDQREHLSYSCYLIGVSNATLGLNPIPYYMKSYKLSTNTAQAFLISEIGREYYKSGELDRAIKSISMSIKLMVEFLGKDHIDVAYSYYYLAQIYSAKGLCSKSIRHLKHSFTLYFNEFGWFHLDVAACLNNLGAMYYKKKNYLVAAKLVRSSLFLYNQIEGNHSNSFANALVNIGAIYYEFKCLDESLNCYKRALAIYETNPGANYLKIATLYMNVGNLFLYKGLSYEAIKYFRQSLHIRSSYPNESAVQIAYCYNGIASAYDNIGHRDESLKHYLYSLEMLITSLGDNHPEVAKVRENMESILNRTSYIKIEC